MDVVIGRTWALMSQSFAVLRADKKLLLFPFLSTLALLAVDAPMLASLAQVYQTGGWDAVDKWTHTPQNSVALFLLYWASYSIVVFFNSALMGCASVRLEGRGPTLADGWNTALARLGSIIVWSLIAATVGYALSLLEERLRLPRVADKLIDFGWTMASFFVVPVLIFENLGLIDSLKRSSELVRQRWGEEVVSDFSFGTVYTVLALPGIVIIVAGMALVGIRSMFRTLQPFGIGIGVPPASPVPLLAVGVAYLGFLMIVFSAVESIFVVALYRYATTGGAGRAFAPAAVETAFRQRPLPGSWS